MQSRYVRWAAAGVLVAVAAAEVPCAETSRIVRSVAFPGMGQLGDNQVGKGLLYMAGEIVLLSLTVDQIVRKAAYDRATRYDSVRVDLAKTFEEKMYYYNDWVEMKDKSDRAAMFTYVFGGAAAVWWVWNVVDAIIFAPRSETGETGMIERLRDNTTVAFGRERAEVRYRLSF